MTFSYTTFGNGRVDFRCADFGDEEVAFRYTNFGKGDADFSEAHFNEGGVDFRETIFGDGKVSFRFANFGNAKVFFESIQCQGSMDFLDLQDPGKLTALDFRGVRVEQSFQISAKDGESFSCVPDLRDAIYGNPLALDGVVCEPKGSDWKKEDIGRLCKLKEIAKTNQNHRQALDFHIQEMRLTRELNIQTVKEKARREVGLPPKNQKSSPVDTLTGIPGRLRRLIKQIAYYILMRLRVVFSKITINCLFDKTAEYGKSRGYKLNCVSAHYR